ncbi:Diphthamide biosynthesis protein 2 [Ataeniobius toweri]|uniref:Diphthamide biosynthesis protein 2 n=1 Tax=Ataeniobius toweri TaxID=208326 RepID=A0ABU7CB03_9TELE|nr:Diphthamide biosynthesis protein 2 [Ataeniobius toweri]
MTLCYICRSLPSWLMRLIRKTCAFINEHNFGKVALQFPDELLVDSAAVAGEIERNNQAKTFILGDTSYGSCCVDEVAAEHVGADCIVHYGSACLSPSKRLPVMYVFEKSPLDVEMCAASFRELYPDTQTNILLLYDVNYDHAIGNFSQRSIRCFLLKLHFLANFFPFFFFSRQSFDAPIARVSEPCSH